MGGGRRKGGREGGREFVVKETDRLYSAEGALKGLFGYRVQLWGGASTHTSQRHSSGGPCIHVEHLHITVVCGREGKRNKRNFSVIRNLYSPTMFPAPTSLTPASTPSLSSSHQTPPPSQQLSHQPLGVRMPFHPTAHTTCPVTSSHCQTQLGSWLENITQRIQQSYNNVHTRHNSKDTSIEWGSSSSRRMSMKRYEGMTEEV